jgi:hypothetical protein
MTRCPLFLSLIKGRILRPSSSQSNKMSSMLGGPSVRLRTVKLTPAIRPVSQLTAPLSLWSAPPFKNEETVISQAMPHFQ